MGPRVVVVGAGAFGGWTALELLRRGARVTLVEAWGPGHARSSSGGETRVIRAGYGSRRIYTRLAARALDRWRAHDERYRRRFLRQIGALWMFTGDDEFGRESVSALGAAGQRVEELQPRDARRRYPQINFEDVRFAFVEPDAGVLLARRACEHVVECVVAEGGAYVCAAAAAPPRLDSDLAELRLEDGAAISGDAFVFACGPWLATLFPDALGRLIRTTRQDVYYFGTAAGDVRFCEGQMPVWLDKGSRLLYGIPGNANRGFKVADDSAGPPFDPTSGERIGDDRAARDLGAYLAHRFPALASAPLIGVEVCQYESTPDAHFVIDRHPAAANVWLAGGGSGHGFKMGPAVGEIVASAVLDGVAPDRAFAIERPEQT